MSRHDRSGITFKHLQAKREAALARPELLREPRPKPVSSLDLQAAIASGKLTRLPAKKRRRS